mmetsp:Transcript_19157/g.49178  ORF Transcript_19157/g.49178 Transcript_19157/m.49178 type:complete len:219 (+) Transcript_19157:961-1617(+)
MVSSGYVVTVDSMPAQAPAEKYCALDGRKVASAKTFLNSSYPKKFIPLAGKLSTHLARFPCQKPRTPESAITARATCSMDTCERLSCILRNACLDPMTFSGLTHVLEMLLAAPPDNKCCHMGALCADAADASSCIWTATVMKKGVMCFTSLSSSVTTSMSWSSFLDILPSAGPSLYTSHAVNIFWTPLCPMRHVMVPVRCRSCSCMSLRNPFSSLKST